MKYYLLLLLAFIFHTEAIYALPKIAFVTQPPLPADFATVNSTFANHRASLDSIPRGGDLYIRYEDGSLKNITQVAGYGMSGFQGASAIAVRDPAVHWSGSKILFSMVIGAPTAQYQVNNYYWQLYEVTGIGKNDTPVITKVANQPSNYNNVTPIYGTDDRIIFATDRPRNGATHLYPQRDEYESTPTNTGLWSLDPSSGDLFQLDHSPSGDFHPIVDSFGRVIFTRWDHLQRDQQNVCSNSSFGAFNYSSEDSNAVSTGNDQEVFPEERADCENGPSNLNNHSFNHFLPWQMNEDGTEMETLNHIGRHELASYLECSFNDDPDVETFYGQYSRLNQHSVENFFHIREDPTDLGTYFGISAPEFGTHTAGQIISINGAPSVHADQMVVTSITHPETDTPDDTPSGNHSGLYRNPLPLSDGTIIATHTVSTREDSNIGSTAFPQSRYEFRLKTLQQSGQYYVPSGNVTSGITETITYWNPDALVTYNNVTLWELQPVEIVARTRPAMIFPTVPTPEQTVFDEAGVTVEEIQDYLRENNLALIVSRNVTTRDNLDHQQPRNLKVAGSTTQTLVNGGKVYEVGHIQFFQGNQVRSYGGSSSSGRRVIAQELQDGLDENPENPTGPVGSTAIASDGSIAAFVPARRAMTWQITDPDGVGVVRERVWLTFQPGEIRVCASCHGVNSKDQADNQGPTNNPEALRDLLAFWKGTPKETAQFQFKLKVNKTKSKKNVSFSIKGLNSKAANKDLKLYLKVKNTECGIVKQFQTNSSGNYDLSNISLPKSKTASKLIYTLSYLGKTIATAKTKLVPDSSSKSLTPNSLCNKIKKKL